MPHANAAKRRVREKHRLTRQKAKAKKREIDTSNPFWRLLLSKESPEAARTTTTRQTRTAPR